MNKNLPDGNERAGNPGTVQNITTWPNLSEVGEKGVGWGRVAGDDVGKIRWGQIAEHLVSHAFKELGLSFVVNRGRTQLTFLSRGVM